MPKNFSQKGFAEIISLIAVAFMLVTIPVAKQLADKRQELRKLAQEADCSVTDKCAGTDDPSQCYKWAGSGCDWNGPLQPEQGECYCKLSRVSASQQQAQQQASSSQTTCDNANYSWCKDGIRYYCNENKSLTPISQKWQEGNSCYVCGAAAREPVSLSECSSDITNQCGEKNNGDAWCEGTTIVQCVRDPSGYLVKNITSTPCSGTQTTTTSEKPAAPAAVQTYTCKSFSCKDPEPDGTYKPYYYKYDTRDNSHQGPYTDCAFKNRLNLSEYCPEFAPANPAPAAQTFGAGTNPCYGLPDNDTTTISNGKTVCCSYGSVVACPPAPAPPAAVTHLYICEEENGTSYAKYYENNILMRSEPCWYGCKSDRECNPAPAQTKEVEIDTTAILCGISNCNQINKNWQNKTIFFNRTAKLGNSFYFGYPCIEKTKINNIEEYCEVKEVKNAEVPAPKITETTEETDAGPQIPQPQIVKPVANPCAEEDDGRAVIHQNSCWTCLNGQLDQMTNNEYCGIKPTPKQQVTQPKPPAADKIKTCLSKIDPKSPLRGLLEILCFRFIIL